jgi:hypothetical protein
LGIKAEACVIYSRQARHLGFTAISTTGSANTATSHQLALAAKNVATVPSLNTYARYADPYLIPIIAKNAKKRHPLIPSNRFHSKTE